MDRIRKDWQDTNVDISLEYSSREAILNGKRKTALQNLAERYRRFSNLGILLVVLGITYCFNPALFSDVYSRVAFGVVFAVYAMVASIMDRWLYYGVRSIDVAIMPVSEVVRKALFYRKRHLQFVLVLLPFVIALIVILAWKIDNLYFMLGIIAGVIVGIAIGIRQLLSFLDDYRTITSNF